MPELPEVETVRLQLLRKVAGKTIASVEVFHSKTVAHDETIEDTLLGKTIAAIDRIGKLLIFSFKHEDDVFVLAHFKMTGQFFFVAGDGETIGGGHSMTAADRDLPGKHTRLAMHFTDHSTLYFNDMRLFGYVKAATAAEVTKVRGGFGPEPIAADFDCDWFGAKLKTRKTSIKAVLLDQTFIAGLGNIYVDEALWRAQIRPTRRADSVTKAEATRLCRAAGDVMNESIAVGGTTFQHFKDTGGQNGNFTDYLKVFGKQGTSCPRCGAAIKKIRVAGRGTHYCPGCQK
ncbi:bifunctional DNA-formamidopyrimidine glycosylase/DNA-(apurinic or apyrimidinic site) lyase [Candidatus Kaiserbacteria bacterium]|nr:bifunctional DNA-formamidopyrimidine glycosylase/DNA-(apurinic or apyrimidinic site) lyase [Candidatus Kaiserbacteria bacterium]